MRKTFVYYICPFLAGLLCFMNIFLITNINLKFIITLTLAVLVVIQFFCIMEQIKEMENKDKNDN